MQKFLIVRFSSIGDIVLTTPVVRMLAEQVPDTQIHYLTKPAFAPIVEANPFIFKVWTWNETQSDLLLRTMADENFTAVIDLHNNLRSFGVQVALDAPCYKFKKLNLEKWLAVKFKKNRLPNTHIVNRYAETLKFLSHLKIPTHLDFFIPDLELKKATERFENLQREKYIVFCVGAQHKTKQMPAEKWYQLSLLVKEK